MADVMQAFLIAEVQYSLSERISMAAERGRADGVLPARRQLVESDDLRR